MTNCNCNAQEVNDYILPVVKNKKLADRLYWMTFEAPALAKSVRAGHSIMVFPNHGTDPLLGRPFAVADADAARGEISVCYVLVGRGTEMMSRVSAGAKLRVRGFLGRPCHDTDDELILAGGGVGAAALMMKKRERRERSSLYIGVPGRGYEDYAEVILSIHPDAKIFADDGSFGEGDSMFKVLPRQLSEGVQAWCCGPGCFLEAMRRHYVDTPQRLYYLLDKRMACGYGGCMGCVIETANGLKRVCVDQSLFRADEVNIHDN
ncbi:MAG: hypothetical protein LUE09_03545 [Synergistaceae bacterium]|nr:hypothetical protein [Synergistaceae bacterium]